MPDATVFCNQCGQPVNAAASFCTRCGGTLTPAVSNAISSGATPRYAGFWIRFVAHLIDNVIVNLVVGPIAALMLAAYFATHHTLVEDPSRGPGAGFFALVGLIAVIAIAATWLYEAWMTSSSKQATLGKMVFRLKVTDHNGARLSFAHATGRFFAKILSGILCIGYIMAGFTERKQALHDIIAGTYVVQS